MKTQLKEPPKPISKTANLFFSEISDLDFSMVQDILYKHAGIKINTSKKKLVQNRLRKRVSDLGMTSYNAYCLYIKEDSAELSRFLDALTTNETYFFREKKHWDFLKKKIIPGLSKERQFSIWSAASSTGGELYTAAIVLRESLVTLTDWNLKLVGSDLNTQVIDKASDGLYKDYDLRNVNDRLRKKYFKEIDVTPDQERWKLSNEIRKICKFSQHNLQESFTLRNFDLVICRNVFIYFDTAAKEKAINHLVSSLALGGYIFFSHTETLIPKMKNLKFVQPSIFRKVS